LKSRKKTPNTTSFTAVHQSNMLLRLSSLPLLPLVLPLLAAPLQKNYSVDAFPVPNRGLPLVTRSSNTPRHSTVSSESSSIKANGVSRGNSNEQQQPLEIGQPTTWQCDDEAVCVEVAACDDQVCRTSLDVRVHGKWYDLSGWRAAHPAGPHWIDWYDGRDATEVMDGFHSAKGREMYKRLPGSKPDTVAMLSAIAPPDSETQLAFRRLRDQLEQDGWWERDMVHEATQIGIWAALVVTAGTLAHTVPPLSCFLLALSMTAAGWLGHDYIHGVDKFAFAIRNFAAFAAGLAPTWWSDKHNKVSYSF
jgi:hypothetical protein